MISGAAAPFLHVILYCLHVCVYACVCVCVYACMCVHVSVCACVCVSEGVCVEESRYMYGEQKTTLSSWFFPSAFTWLPGMTRRPSVLGTTYPAKEKLLFAAAQ